MPTVFTHVAVPLACAVALGSKRVPPAMLAVGMVAAVAPDFDGLAFKLGIEYGSLLGHRGFTHSLLFALALGVLGALAARLWRGKPWQGFVWVALCTLSHPLLDMATNGGAGVPLWWPLSGERLFWPWRPVEVSPVSLSRFLSLRGASVLRSELHLIWAPLMLIALSVFALRHSRISR